MRETQTHKNMCYELLVKVKRKEDTQEEHIEGNHLFERKIYVLGFYFINIYV